MRLLTWNVQWCRGLDGVVDPARIAREARRLADPDVLCLQEISVGFISLPGSHGENQVDALRAALPGYQVFYVIASRFPVGRVLRHALPWPPATVPSMPRAALEAVIEAPFGPLRIVTTHLEYFSSGHRAAQIERLRELHGEANLETVAEEDEGPFRPSARPQAAIVCGDFNLPPDDPLRARFLEAFAGGAPTFVDAWERLHPGAAHPHTFRVHEREKGESPYCCDYVFVTENLAPRLRAISIDRDNRASDHQPVIVALE